MEPTPRKTSIKIWTPLLERFSQRIDSACLRRDAWLTKVLDRELDELDAEIATPNSEAAQRFIATHLDTLPRKLVTLTLPAALVQRLDDICASKRIVRDSFFNRLFFLLVASHKHTRLFFDENDQWFQDVLGLTDFHVRAATILLDPIPDFRDPFLAIREGLDTDRDRLIKEFGSAERADEYLRDRRIYTAPITDQTFPKVDLFGLNVYLPDTMIPGTDENRRLLDDVLGTLEATGEEKQP